MNCSYSIFSGTGTLQDRVYFEVKLRRFVHRLAIRRKRENLRMIPKFGGLSQKNSERKTMVKNLCWKINRYIATSRHLPNTTEHNGTWGGTSCLSFRRTLLKPANLKILMRTHTHTHTHTAYLFFSTLSHHSHKIDFIITLWGLLNINRGHNKILTFGTQTKSPVRTSPT